MNSIIIQGMGDNQALVTHGYGGIEQIIPPIVDNGPSGGGGNSKDINPKLPDNRRPTVNWQQSQWYNTSVKIPIIVESFENNNINTGVMSEYIKNTDLYSSIKAISDMNISVSQGINFNEIINSKSHISITHKNNIEHSLCSGVTHKNNISCDYKIPICYSSKVENNITTTTVHEDTIVKNIKTKVANLKLLDILDLL